MIDPDVQELIDEEVSRLDDPEGYVKPLSILEQRGGEPRWESDRYNPPTSLFDKYVDGFLAYADGEPEPPPGAKLLGWLEARKEDVE